MSKQITKMNIIKAQIILLKLNPRNVSFRLEKYFSHRSFNEVFPSEISTSIKN